MIVLIKGLRHPQGHQGIEVEGLRLAIDDHKLRREAERFRAPQVLARGIVTRWIIPQVEEDVVLLPFAG
jgi:hypothetical protein